MQRRINSVALLLCGVAAIAGCDTDFMGSWGELGDEQSIGPYKCRIPKGFKLTKQGPGAPGETQVVFEKPRFGRPGPGFSFTYAPHQGRLNPDDWGPVINAAVGVLRRKCRNFTHEQGTPTTLNGLPAVRLKFNGDFEAKGKSYDLQAVGYLVLDGTYLMMAMGMDFGSAASSSLPKLEEAIKTLNRPGYTPPPSPSRSSSTSSSVASTPGHPGHNSFAEDSFAEDSFAEDSFAEDSSAGSSYPGSTSTGGSYPGAGRPGGMGSRFGPTGTRPGGMTGSGFPSRGPGMRGSRSGYPGSGYAGRSRMGSGASGSSSAVDPEEARRRAEEAQRRAAAAKRASELAVTAANPGDPEFYPANLELLRIGNDTQKEVVLKRLADISPSDIPGGEMRKELARGLRNVAEDAQVGLSTRREAIPVLVEWTASYSVPILIGLLQDKQRLIQLDALEYLNSFQDDRSIGPVTELFVNNPVLRDKAAECLRGFGTAAEDKVLKLSRPTDLLLTRATVQLLGDIGTDKSLRPIGQLRKLGFYSMLKKDINEAVAKIRERSEQEK